MSKEFLKAVWNGEYEKVKEFLEDPTLDMNATVPHKDEGKLNALDMAASRGHIEILKLLLQVGRKKEEGKPKRLSLDPDPVSGRTALHLAVKCLQVEAVKILLRYGDLLEVYKERIPYYLATDLVFFAKGEESKQKALEIKELLKVPTYVMACWKGNLYLVQQFVEREGVDPQAEFDVMKPLLLACTEGQISVVEYLLSKAKFDLNQKTKGIDTILHHMAGSHPLSKTDISFIRHTDRNGILSGQSKQSRIAQMLIERGADINAVNNQGATPLLYAVIANRIDLVITFIENGADLTRIYNWKGEELDIFELARSGPIPEIYGFLKETAFKRGQHKFPTAQENTITYLFVHPYKSDRPDPEEHVQELRIQHYT